MEYNNLDMEELARAVAIGFRQDGKKGFQFAISEFVRIFSREFVALYGDGFIAGVRLRLNLGIAVPKIHRLALERIAAQQD